MPLQYMKPNALRIFRILLCVLLALHVAYGQNFYLVIKTGGDPDSVDWTLFGIEGTVWTLQSSLDLDHWEPLEEGQEQEIGASGSFTVNSTLTGAQWMFFRAIEGYGLN